MIIEANGASVHVRQLGEGPKNVLLLHGWGCSMALMDPVAQALSSRARVTLLDFPGHGESGRPPVPWGAEDFARMTAEVMEALGIAGGDIIAHSHGGRVALTLALARPDLPGRLVLTGAAGLRARPTQAQAKRATAYRRLRALADAAGRVPGLAGASRAAQASLRKKYGSADYNALDEEMRATFVRVVNTDLTDRLGDVRASTLLIWGDQDTETPLWMGRLMEEKIPDAGLVVLPGTHFAYLERLSDFLRITEHFLFGGTV